MSEDGVRSTVGRHYTDHGVKVNGVHVNFDAGFCLLAAEDDCKFTPIEDRRSNLSSEHVH